MQLQALCLHLTALLLLIASPVQAGPVGLAHRDVLESGGYIEKRGELVWKISYSG